MKRGAGRNRTADKGFADPCLTTWRPRRSVKIIAFVAQEMSREIARLVLWLEAVAEEDDEEDCGGGGEG
jgi:hypothetical protein